MNEASSHLADGHLEALAAAASMLGIRPGAPPVIEIGSAPAGVP